MSELISAEDCKKIGFKFASRYYNTCFLQKERAEKLSSYFGRDSSINFVCNDDRFEASGKEGVAKELARFLGKNKFTALDLENNSEVMATPMDNSGILVLVTGRIGFNDSELRNFSQSFVLKKQNRSYYCRNAMLAVSANSSPAPAAVEAPAKEPVQAPAAPAVVKAAPAAAKAPKAPPAKESKAPVAKTAKSAAAPKQEAAKAAKPAPKAEQKAPAAPAGAPVKSSWAGVAGNAGDGKFKEVRPKAAKPPENAAATEANGAGPVGRKDRKPGKPGNGKEPAKPAAKQPSGVFVLFVKNVVSDTTEEEFKTAFKKFGKVEKVEIKRKPNKEFATGYVTFTSPKTVDKVLEQTRGGMSFKGADLEMEAAKQSVQYQKPKGGGKGKGGAQRRNRGGKDRRDSGKGRREGAAGPRK
jgi:hypothetical protein|eukprot:g4954.t1